MGNTRKEIKQRAVEIYKKIDPDFGNRVETKLGFKTADAKL
jgi:catalase